jgi:hypothetical protein
MRRNLLAVGGLIVATSLGTHPASGQEPRPPLVPPGLANGPAPIPAMVADGLRLGELSALQFAMGTPYFFMSRALSDAIDTSTIMTWNEYYQSILDLQNRQHRARRSQRLKLYNQRQQRILEDPGEVDLMLGDAPNAVLAVLSNPRIGPSSLRRYGETIPGETIQRITFHFGTGEAPISLGRLTVRDGWPLALRDAAFDRERRAYQDALEVVLESSRQGKLTPEAFRDLQRAVEALHRKLQEINPTLQRQDFAVARAFLDNLADAVEPLRQPVVEKILAAIDSYSGTTVGDLVIFMQRFNLRFAPAVSAEERETYHALYSAMLRLRDMVGPVAVGPGRSSEGEAAASSAPIPIPVQPGRDAIPGIGRAPSAPPAEQRPGSEEKSRSRTP